jgi:hypothetical protein
MIRSRESVNYVSPHTNCKLGPVPVLSLISIDNKLNKKTFLSCKMVLL